jgi:hypothetical protein
VECTAHRASDGVGTYYAIDFVPDPDPTKRDGREEITLHREQGKVNLQNIP